MSEPGIVFLFPAFARDYKEDQSRSIPGYSDLLKFFLEKASCQVEPALAFFDPVTLNFLTHELNNQYITYIHSCVCSSLLRRLGSTAGILAGYSMGIYAALFDSGSITFETGLDLIKNAYREIREVTYGQDFLMCSIIGLNLADIKQLIVQTDPETEISNRNGEFSFILSGRLSSVHTIVSKAKTEGAIHTYLFDVREPYHSWFLRKTEQGFSEYVHQIKMTDPVTPLLSVIDQTLLNSSDQLKREVIRNLYKPLNWYQTHLKLTDLGYKNFIECSPLPALTKIGRFIPGDANYYSPLSAIKSPFFPDL